jgi:hypothetical protein
MYPGTDMYAIGTDETISFFALQSQKEEEEEPAPKVWGDVREGLGCEYVVDLGWAGQQAFVAAGKHRYVVIRLLKHQDRADLSQRESSQLHPY